MSALGRGAAIALAASGTAVGTLAVLRRRLPGGAGRWQRTNFRGATVQLCAGPAAVAGAAAGALVAEPGGAAPLLVLAAGGLGLYDDLTGGVHARGLGGHLRALRRGELTTGVVKLVGLTAAAALTAATRRDRRAAGDVLLDTALVAGSANLVNLLDLRPGRALKVVTLVAVPMAARDGVAAAAAVTAVTLLPVDLGEQQMLGDCGANALGALLGLVLTGRGRGVRQGALGLVVGLTLLSERVSFSAAIERIGPLAALDRLGRMPT